MRLGAVFPQTEIGSDPGVIRDFAQTIEGLGYDHLLVYDHVLGADPKREPKLTGPYTDKSLFHEPFVLFGYLAAATTNLELVTGVLVLPQRQTGLVAKQAAEVDVLSSGRLRLGVGVGWNYVEFDALGEDFSNRGERQEEQVDLLRRLWTEPLVDYKGEYHRVDRAGILPLPGRSIPVWFGGFSSVAYRRAARIGDGFIYGGNAQSASQALEETRGYLRSANRNDVDFGAELISMTRKLDDVDHLVGEVRQWREVGGTHFSLVSMDYGLDSPKAHLDAFERFKRAVDDSGVLS